MEKIKKVIFTFDDDRNKWVGYTDGSTWNGWPNIWIKPKVHSEMIKEYKNDEDMWGGNEEYYIEFVNIPRVEKGIFKGMHSLAYGYTPDLVTNEKEGK